MIKKIYFENRITERITDIMMYLLFIDGISTFILVGVFDYPEQNLIVNIINSLISNWFFTIIIWITVIYSAFFMLEKVLGYKLRREYRAVILVYIFNLLIAIIGNIFFIIREIRG